MIIPIRAWIRNNSTGEVREWAGAAKCPLRRNSDGDVSLYWWAEGDASCDCMRSDWFGGLQHDECSEGLFSVKVAGLDGTVYLDEISAALS